MNLNFTLSESAMASMNTCNGAVPILIMVLQLQMSAHTMSTCAHPGPRPFLILPSHRDLPLQRRTCSQQLEELRANSTRSTRQFWSDCLAEGRPLRFLQTGWSFNFSTLMESLPSRHYLWVNVFLTLQLLSHKGPSWYVFQMKWGLLLNQNPNNVLEMTMLMTMFPIYPSLR